MSELSKIGRDIRSGALPLNEIPGFIAWAFRKIAWLLIGLAVGGTVVAFLIQ
jgi:hypothetical protein